MKADIFFWTCSESKKNKKKLRVLASYLENCLKLSATDQNGNTVKNDCEDSVTVSVLNAWLNEIFITTDQSSK